MSKDTQDSSNEAEDVESAESDDSKWAPGGDAAKDSSAEAPEAALAEASETDQSDPVEEPEVEPTEEPEVEPTPAKKAKPAKVKATAVQQDPAHRTGRKEIPKVGDGDVVIAARRLSLWYGQVIGINDITLDIGTGVLGLLGPNGAGKSTFLKVLTGQLQPSTGTVGIFGEIIWNNRNVMSRIGFVPEQDSFYEDMTGREFVQYLTRLQGFSPSDAMDLADEAIEEVQLTDQRDRRIREYSKGMRQRIKIAQALAHKPEILFLDEPLAGTDPVGRRHIINIIRKLGDEGRTVVVSSHILHEVEQMTNNIVLINKGRVVADGNIYRIREMIDEHAHTIFVDCDQPRRFASLVAQFDDVVSLEFSAGGVHIATKSPDACYARIPKLALDEGISIRRITSPDNNLMAVFRYLVN